MSGCRHGGRDVYERPVVREQGHMDCYRFKAVFRDADPVSFVISRRTADGERHLDHFEAEDGSVRYMPRPARDFDEIREVVE